MEISVLSHRQPERLDLSAFERLAAFALDREDAPDAIELSVVIVSLEEMTSLNEKYRAGSGPTDVLSFPCDDPCAIVGPGESVALGDVVLAPEVAEAQAAEYGHTVEEELNLLTVHGILHLLGYDHEAEEEAAAMQERERVILAAWANAV
jgi:probable rRNA maturation factor